MSQLLLNRSQLLLNGLQPVLRRKLALFSLPDDPHERVLPGMGIVERETLVFAISTDEFLFCIKSSFEQGEILKESYENSPVHSTQYQQGNDTAF